MKKMLARWKGYTGCIDHHISRHMEVLEGTVPVVWMHRTGLKSQPEKRKGGISRALMKPLPSLNNKPILSISITFMRPSGTYPSWPCHKHDSNPTLLKLTMTQLSFSIQFTINASLPFQCVSMFQDETWPKSHRAVHSFIFDSSRYFLTMPGL